MAALRSLWPWAARAAVTAALLGWLAARQDVREGLAAAAFSRPLWLGGALACGAAAAVFAAWRWHACLAACGCPLPFRAALRVSLAANAAGLFAPGSLGVDAVRVALAARSLPDKKAALAASVALDHACAFPAFLLLAGGLAAASGVAAGLDAGALRLLVPVAAAALAGGVWLRLRHRELHDRLLSWLRARLSARGTRHAAFLSIPVLAFHYGIFWCAAAALPLPAPGGAVFTAVAVADAAASLPVSLAGLGVREKSFESLLQHWHAVPAALSVKASLTGWVIVAFWAVVGAACVPFRRMAPDA